MSLGWVFSNYIRDLQKKIYPIDNIPKNPINIKHDMKQTMKKNKSIDDFMKHHVPWIL